jgi:large subunit ribosomal protein L15
MPLARRVPKRGFNNTRYEKFYQTVNLRDLAAFENGDMVDYDALLERRLVNRKTGFVKLLAKGGVEKKLHVKVHRASKSAVEQIEKAGGKVELIG